MEKSIIIAFGVLIFLMALCGNGENDDKTAAKAPAQAVNRRATATLPACPATAFATTSPENTAVMI